MLQSFRENKLLSNFSFIMQKFRENCVRRNGFISENCVFLVFQKNYVKTNSALFFHFFFCKNSVKIKCMECATYFLFVVCIETVFVVQCSNFITPFQKFSWNQFTVYNSLVKELLWRNFWKKGTVSQCYIESRQFLP